MRKNERKRPKAVTSTILFRIVDFLKEISPTPTTTLPLFVYEGSKDKE